VNEAVLDASVVVKWFHNEGGPSVEVARKLRGRYEAGDFRVLAPRLLWLELLNIAVRRWGWQHSQLEHLAATLEQLGFELLEPELLSVARWAANGLTPYDAAYVAVAEQAGVQLITDDEQILAAAPGVATALGGLSSRS
jgi:predicted nucleic acid-binding protein